MFGAWGLRRLYQREAREIREMAAREAHETHEAREREAREAREAREREAQEAHETPERDQLTNPIQTEQHSSLARYLSQALDSVAFFILIFTLIRVLKQFSNLVSFSRDNFSDIQNYANIPEDMLIHNKISHYNQYKNVGKPGSFNYYCTKAPVFSDNMCMEIKHAFKSGHSKYEIVATEFENQQYDIINSLLFKFSNDLLRQYPDFFSRHPFVLKIVSLISYWYCNFACFEYLIAVMIFFTVQITLHFTDRWSVLVVFLVKLIDNEF